MRRPSSLSNSSSGDQKITTIISPAVIFDSSSLFRAVMGRTDISPAALLERVIANGYMQGAHQEENNKKDDTKYVEKTLKDHVSIFGRLTKAVKSIQASFLLIIFSALDKQSHIFYDFAMVYFSTSQSSIGRLAISFAFYSHDPS